MLLYEHKQSTEQSTMSEKDDATKTRGGGRKKRVVEVDETEKDGTIAKYSRIAKKISVKVFFFFTFQRNSNFVMIT